MIRKMMILALLLVVGFGRRRASHLIISLALK